MLVFMRLPVSRHSIKLLITLLCLSLNSTGNAANNQKLISQKEFTEYFISKIKSNKIIKRIIIQDDANIAVTFTNKVRGRVYLGNAYRRYTNKPDTFNQIISSFANSLISMGIPKDARILNTKIILPIIRHKDYVKNSNIRFAKQSKAMKQKGSSKPFNELLTQTLTNEVLILFALDTRHNYQYLTTNDLKRYKTTLKDISKHAYANINRLTPTIKKLSEGMYSIKFDNNLDVSFLLQHKLWQSTRFIIKGNLLVYLPTRNMLIVTGTKDFKNQFIMKKWLDKNYRKLSYFISDIPLTREGKKWVPYTEKLTFKK